MASSKRYWLMKSEPRVYSINDLERDGSTSWEGVRNYQARNFMRDEMNVGDLVLFYHSNAAPPGVAGIARVSKVAYPDPTQFDRRSKHYDKKSSRDDPRWVMIDVGFVEKLPAVVPLEVLKNDPRLEGLLVIRRGQRLSIQPIEKEHFEIIRKLGRSSRTEPSASSRKAARS